MKWKQKSPITFQHLFTMTSGIPYPGDQSYSARSLAGVNREEGNNWAGTILEGSKRIALFINVQTFYHFSFL
jgi:CubicO group peptidase (beta-lactamase class C family)